MSHQTPLSSVIQSLKAPWVMLLVLNPGDHVERIFHIPDGFSLQVLRGAKCRTGAGLFQEFARTLKFPDYFGHNWDALEECLADLEWLPAKGYVLAVTEAEQVLTQEEEDYSTFLEVLSDAGEAWATGQAGSGSRRPFHVILTVSEPQRLKRAHWAIPEVELGADVRRRLPKTVRKRPSAGT
ncbi:MAG: barstar family protein [Nitrospira sp.]|nr:barstar family protein [Nitrospira sp.]